MTASSESMADAGTQVRSACRGCDLIVDLSFVHAGERADCPRCGSLLMSRTPDAHRRSLALAVTSLLLLSMANAFPFLALRSGGLEKVMTLPRSALELYREGDTLIAFLVFAPIAVVPGLMLVTLTSLLWQLRSGRSASWVVPAGRVLFLLSPWSMVEVFLIGVLVSLVKIGSIATVVLGISFWTYVGFAMTFTAALASLDRLEIWSEIEACTPG